LDASFLSANNDGLEELIVLALLVSLLDGLDWVSALLTLAGAKSLETNLNSVPSLVTVHCVVSTNNTGNLTDTDLLDLGKQCLHISGTGLRVGVTAISEEVNVDIWNSNFLGDLEESVEMVLLGVLRRSVYDGYNGAGLTYNTTIRDETSQVKTTSTFLGIFESVHDDLVLAQLALLDRLINTDDILPNNTSSADVQMTDLGVAHQTLWETNGEGRSVKLSVPSSILGESIHVWGLCSGNGIAILRRRLRRDTPTINHDYNARQLRSAMPIPYI
jgi:hypothetical protein